MQKEIKKPKKKEYEDKKYKNHYKYLGLKFQNTGRLTAQIDPLKIKLKNNCLSILLIDKKFISLIILKKFFLTILLS
jgi:hypothetical protein